MALKSLYSLFSSDLAIDFGTHSTVVYAKGRGITCSESSLVAVNKNSEVVAIGGEVDEILSSYPEQIAVISPLKEGAITRLDLAEKLIQYCILKAHNGKAWASPRVVVGVNPSLTQVERHAVESCVARAGASEVYLMEAAIAAAHGVGMPVSEPAAMMIVDIGGGTTDIDVISMGRTVYSRSIRVAGINMDNSIIYYIKQKHNLLIGKRVAERIKVEVGSAWPLDEARTMTVQGRHLLEGDLRSINISDEEVREALSDDVSTIINSVRVAIDRSPADFAGDLAERGLILTGGGALLSSLDKRLSIETGLPVSMAEDPKIATVLGLGMTLSDFELHKRLKLGNPLYGSDWEP